MKKYPYKKILLGLSTLLLLGSNTLYAEDYEDLIDSDYLKKEFTFKDGEKMKYEKCSDDTFPKCKYIWGKETEKSLKKDASRKKYNLPPSGKKVMIVYAQASAPSDFDRVKNALKGSKEVEGVGVAAIWKGSRAINQLSFITDKNIIIHISIDGDIKDKKTHTMNIAKYLLEELE